jgi:hypothetical protein
MIEGRFYMTTKIPTFDGNAGNFASWWKDFLAHTTMSGFKDVLKEECDKSLPEEEVSSNDHYEFSKKQVRTVRKNDKAITSFSLPFSTDKAMQIMYVACAEA